ncbi:MAG: hypothetical protein LWW79_08650 [Holophagaceae bacterium]|nr:hypothetical protein [Holophagaceae bacterium]
MTDHKRGGGFYLTLFGLIGLLFVGILIATYQIAKKANPVMLDEQGRPQPTHRS